MIRTDNTETMTNALQRIQELEAENRSLRSKLKTLDEALQGAQNIVRQLRDRDSDLPVDFGHVGQVAG